jgi:hypothetical protein
MLGTGRPSVSLAAGSLESTGLIENLRGSVKIINRKSLENAACECYAVNPAFQRRPGPEIVVANRSLSEPMEAHAHLDAVELLILYTQVRIRNVRPSAAYVNRPPFCF